ncbi:ricin B lectin domain-containing protein [Crucibulum laeve]|uniref:Ricin B lectin domain-containing protein n=1 Tax=Crucibulum laeve TaxID=68775 RepID=A0A5C3M999_9AGAR|nr:ricin B lectin domain-containing protein [Crucibulum laeve]
MSIQPGRYKITNVKHQEFVLDLSGTDQTSVIAWNSHGGPNQQWDVEFDNGQFSLKNVGLGKFLGHEEIDGRELLVGVDHPVTWHFEEVEPDVYRRVLHPSASASLELFVPHTNKNADLEKIGAEQGTQVQLWAKWTPGQNQTWRFEREYTAEFWNVSQILTH